MNDGRNRTVRNQPGDFGVKPAETFTGATVGHPQLMPVMHFLMKVLASGRTAFPGMTARISHRQMRKGRRSGSATRTTSARGLSAAEAEFRLRDKLARARGARRRGNGWISWGVRVCWFAFSACSVVVGLGACALRPLYSSFKATGRCRQVSKTLAHIKYINSFR